MDILRKALVAVSSGQTVVTATVVEVRGHAPRGPGSRMLIGVDGATSGSVGGGEIERVVLPAARELLASGTTVTSLLDAQTDCGGVVRVFLERHAPARRLVVVGAGHIGRALVPLAQQAGFAVTVFEPSGQPAEVAGSDGPVVPAAGPEALDAIEHLATAHVVIATGSHDADRAWALGALERGFAGVGVIGSKGKASAIRKAATTAGMAEDRLARLRCPVGLPIRAITPTEIAISVVAELIQLTAPPKEPPRGSASAT